MKKVYNEYSEINDLKSFAVSVNAFIKSPNNKYNVKTHLENLMKLERQYLLSVWKFQKQTREIYKKFILTVIVKNKNILSARPFFREKAVFFNQKISPAIRDAKIDEFKKFNINFLMVDFIRKSWIGAFPAKSQELYDQIKKLRDDLVNNNLPLVINKAKSHFRGNYQAHIELMDIIGTAASGLIDGIDKYVGPYSKVFIGVCMGRMTGDMIEESSQTQIHFYPSDKMIIYRANSLRKRYRIKDIHTLCRAVNQSLEQDKKDGKKIVKSHVEVAELERLLNAASLYSIDASYEEQDLEANKDTKVTVLDNYKKKTDEISLEERIDQKDAWTKAFESLKSLDVLEKKIIRLKGVKL